METEIKVIDKFPIDRWGEYKNLRIEAIKNDGFAFSQDLDEVISQSNESFKEALEKNLKDVSLLIFIESNNRLIGMIGGRIFSKEKFKHNASMDALYVSPEFRGKGLGELLETKMIERIASHPQVQSIISEVFSSQESSYKLQKKLGFEVVGIYKDFVNINGKYYDDIFFQKKIR